MVILLILLISNWVAWAHADDAPPSSVQQAAIVDQYNGGFRDDYLQELSRVRIYLTLAEQEISVQLGLLQYGNGFRHPVTVRFTDGASANNENPFFYVQSQPASDSFNLQLMVNVEAYARHVHTPDWNSKILKNGFYYAITQLILSDLSSDPQDDRFPLWVREGLSVLMASDGDELVKSVASQTPRSQVAEAIGELNHPSTYLNKRDWARYYLAMKFISDKGGSATLQAFVRNLSGGQSVADAVQNSMSQQWGEFENAEKDFATKVFLEYAPDDTIQPPTFYKTHPPQN